MATLLFFLLSALCVGGILGMILSRNAAYSALCLVPSFAALGALFGLLGGPFIAVVQVIIYAGAVMVLFLFVVMMIPLRPAPSFPKRKAFFALSVVLAACLLALIVLSLSASLKTSAAAAPEGFGGVGDIGRLLFTDLLYPFEITSLVILAALVGALILAKKKKSP